MNLKKIVPLGVALVLGLVAARMAVKILHSKPAAPVAAGPKISQVIVLAKDVAAGDELTDDDLSTGQVVADSAPSNSFSDSADLIGRVAAGPLVKGQTIFESMLAPKGSGGGLQAAIPKGMRAVTIEINETSGVAGYIVPGSRVDLLESMHGVDSSDMFTRTVAQNVQVTAVGMRTNGISDPTQAHSVTLLVTPRQAEVIELSSVNGHPRLVLRNDRDDQNANVPNLTLNELTGMPNAPPLPKPVMDAGHGGDPFGPTTKPAVAAKPADAAPAPWQLRVIVAGEPSVVDVRDPSRPPNASTDEKEIDNP